MSEFMESMATAMQINQPVGIGEFAAPVPQRNTSFMTGLTSVVGGLASFMRGDIEGRALGREADQLEGEASQDELAGQDDVIKALTAMNENLASVTASGAASGIGTGGSLFATQERVIETGETNIEKINLNTRLKAQAKRGTAEQKRSDSGLARLSGLQDASFGVLNEFNRRQRRG